MWVGWAERNDDDRCGGQKTRCKEAANDIRERRCDSGAGDKAMAGGLDFHVKTVLH